MLEKVFVVTSVELGWDCVCGVFSTREAAESYCKGDEDEENEDKNSDSFHPYIIHEEWIQ